MKTIWIAWEKHRRTSEIAASLGDVGLFQLESNSCFLVRYFSLIARTILVLLRHRPKLVIVQSPSLLLSVLAIALGKVFGFRLIVDAHNGGVRPFHSKYKWTTPIFGFIHKYADATIVTNDVLARVIKKNGGTPFVLEDKIPKLNKGHKISLKGDFNLVAICTFEDDEPYQEIIQCAKLLDKRTYIYLTGRYEKINKEIVAKAPSNVFFTGFLPEQDYVNLLNSCNAIIDLTLEPDCLVCGAYEAVATETPVILSNDPSLRNYFFKGAVYVENNAESLAEGIKALIEHEAEIKHSMHQLKGELQMSWSCKLLDLKLLIERLSSV